MRTITATLLFLFFGAALAREQRFTGQVVDSLSGESLAGATIYASPGLGTLTDVNGFFSIDLPDSVREVRVSYVGYIPRMVPVSATHVTVYLHLTGVLDPVVISAGKYRQREAETTVSISSLQPYLIHNRINSSMQDAITQIPGVSSTDGQANIRSGSGWSYGTGSRVSVLVDGMPLLSGGSGQAHWSFFPLENVEQVEVIKGSSSVMYGSSALNGVIHIRTQWPGNRELVSASVFTGVYGTPPNPNWKWQGNRWLARHGRHFLYGKGSDRMQYVFSIYSLDDNGWRMGEPDQRLRLSFKTRFFSKDKKLKYGLSGNMQQGKTGSFLLWENYDLAYTALDSTFGLNNSSRINLDPFVEYHGNRFEHFLTGRYYRTDNRIDQVNGEPDQTNASDMAYMEYRVRYKAFEESGWIFNAGLVNQYSEARASMFMGRRTTQNQAAYVQIDFKKGRWNLSAGGRYEYFRLERYREGRPVFKAGLNFRAAKATWLRASLGQGYRFPVISEAFIRTSAGPVSIYPNPDLKAESGYTTEIGLRQGLGQEGKLGIVLDFAVYRMEFRNMMEFTFGQWGTFADPLFGLGFKSLNIGPSVIQGFELTASGGGKWKKLDILFLAGYTYADPVNRDPDFVYASPGGFPYTYKLTSTDSTGRTLKYRNRHLIRADLQIERMRWGAGISYRYASAYDAIDLSFVSAPLNAVLTGIAESMEANKHGSHVTDLRCYYRITSDLKFTFTINNLFNAEVLQRPADIQAPRYFTIQLGYRY